MSIFTGFRMDNDLSSQLKKYCSDNKLNTTEALNIAVQKLVSRQVVGNAAGNAAGQANGAVVDEIYKMVCKHFLLYKNFSIKNPDAEINDAERQINNNVAVELKKIKGGE